MTERYFPFDAGDGDDTPEADWVKMAQMWAPDGVDLRYANYLLPYGDSSGKQVKVPTGRAFVGGHYYSNDAIITLSLADNSSGNPRIDSVVLRADRTANTVAAVILQGTAAATPAAPTLTQTDATWEVRLANIAVANGFTTVAAADVTDQRAIAVGIDGASGSRVKLAQQTLSASGVLTFTNIPQTFRSLHLKVWTRSSFAATSAACRYRFNSDGGANYTWQRQFASNTTASADRFVGNTDGDFGSQPGASATAGQFGAYSVDIFDYTSTGAYKHLSSAGGYTQGSVPIVMQVWGDWANVAPITSILVGDDHSLTTGLATGSYGVLYADR